MSKPTDKQVKLWLPVLQEAMRKAREAGDKRLMLRHIAEFAMNDEGFLDAWKAMVPAFEEPVRHRAKIFISRLENRGDDWNFDAEFRRCFN